MARSLLILLSTALVVFASTSVPRALQWSSTTYDPDGPWHAIRNQIGTPAQDIDLFPGGFWQSNILSSALCPSRTEACSTSLLAGVYDPSKSSTQFSISETGFVQNSTFEDKGLLTLEGSAEYVFDSMTITTVDPPSASVNYQDFDMLVITEGYSALPNGTNYTIEVGNLALGAPNINQSWIHNGELFNSSLVPSSLYLQGQTPSNSFGMHIDSVAMSVPPSIYIGGYDQSRILGNVIVQDYNMHYFPIDPLDIGIGVAEGSSPFTFNSKSGLLAYGNSSIGVAMQVIVEPVSPFLYLPKSTCDAIAQYLPVTYNSNLGLYFWDTASSAYKTIVASPSYLSFTFRLNSSITETTTINVPFSLLNLTLTPPLVASPTQYFPCTPYDYGKSYDIPTLGRAFLQAAFLGVNWGLTGKGAWFLAQAPGPNTPSQAVVQSIGVDDNFITPSTNDWAETWKGSWTVLSSSGSPSPSSSSNPNETSSSGLSTGSKAGLAVGVVLAACIAVAAAVWFWRRRKRSETKKNIEGMQAAWQRVEMDAEGKRLTELGAGSRKAELHTDPTSVRSELEVDQRPTELPG
jgi:hypothetical protein